MTSEEHAAVQQYLQNHSWEFLLPVFLFPVVLRKLFLGILFVGAPIGILMHCTRIPYAGQYALMLGGVAGLVLAVREKIRRAWRDRKARLAYQRDLESKVVEVLHCTAGDAIEIDIEPPIFFIDLGNSETLYVRSYCLQEVHNCSSKDRTSFPNREFELVRAPHSGLVFSVHCLAQPFEAALDKGDYHELYNCFQAKILTSPMESCLLQMSLNSLQKGLRKLKMQEIH